MTYPPAAERPTTQPDFQPADPPAVPDAQHPSSASAQSTPPGASAGLTKHGRVKPTRISAVWVGLIIAALVMIALLIFIAQNSNSVTLHFLGFSGGVSLAVALLLAAVGGVLLVAIPGTARIVQLRRALKKNAAASPPEH
jgi:uncharacterized integral membrane protein